MSPSRSVATFFMIGLAASMSLGTVYGTTEETTGRLQAVLESVEASYGPEDWKYDPAYFEGAFTGPTEAAEHMTNLSASYFSALGYRVRLSVSVVDEAGNSVTDSNIAVRAKIDTPSGPVVPFILRDSQNLAVFHLDFDVDGSLGGGPMQQSLPPLPIGFQTVDVSIVETSPAPTSPDLDRGGNAIAFVYDRPTNLAIGVDRPRPVHQQLPEDMFRLYNDLGYGDDVDAIDQPVALDENVTLAYTFPSSPNTEVILSGFVAVRGVPTSAPAGGGTGVPGGTVPWPHVPGVTDDPAAQSILSATDTIVAVERTEIARATTDAMGRVVFAITPDKAAGQAALLVVVAELASPAVPAGQPMGGPAIRVGAREVVIPAVARAQVSNPVMVDRFDLEPPFDNSAAEQTRLANQLTVRVVDPETGAANRGDLFSVDREAPANQPRLLAKGSLSPDPDPTRDSHRTGRLSTSTAQMNDIHRYRVYGLLYGADDVFYTITYADRGFEVDLLAPLAYLGGQGRLFINLTSWTTNYDNTPGESGFQLPVRIEVSSADLGLNQSFDVMLAEGGRESRTVLVSASSVGDQMFTVSAWAPDLRTGDLDATVRFVDEPKPRSFVDRIPGFEFVLLVAAIVVAAGWVHARRAK